MIGGTLHTLWTIYRLRAQGEPLDLKAALLRPTTPLAYAAARSVPGFGLWAGQVLTAVAREGSRSGFVQARWRRGVPAQDLLYIAPTLAHHAGAAWLWQRLMHELVQKGSRYGVQRIFAHLPEERHGEIEVMRMSGFSIFSQDRIYRLAPTRALLTSQPNQVWKVREPIDEWGLTRLYLALTPAVVQQAENPLAIGSGGQVSWWGGPRHGGYVLRGELMGEVGGYLRLTKGDKAHWLKMVLHPTMAERGEELLQQAFGLMVKWPRRPIYCDIRDYEHGLTATIEQAGFERMMTRLLLVRHTTSAVRIAKPRVVLEALAEPVPTSR